jgi:prolyl-tRNA synthetase
MKFSELFTKTLREDPADEVAINAKLLARAGFIYKEMAGVYAYLPLGLRVLKKIEGIIREEMNAIGGQEVLLTTLQDPEIWKKTGRWDDAVVDNWFKTKLAGGGEVGIANTHEEPLVRLLTHYVSSYKDLPLALYQFQTKFRNELRAKSGIMRVREFIMKDLYSFSRSEEEFKEFYEQCAGAYEKIFDRVGIGPITYRTIAAGGSFTTGFTDEFQTLSSAGEDIIYIDERKKRAINKEVYNDEAIARAGLKKSDLREEKAIEVGNIFPLGVRYAEALGLLYTNEQGERKPAVMGSYGIGLGRLMGTIVETHHDEKGIMWPEEVAPYQVHLIEIKNQKSKIKNFGEKIYKKFTDERIDVLYDDREEISAGEKFADADLIGVPTRVVISEKTLAQNAAEVKQRSQAKATLVPLEKLRYATK